MKSVDIKKFRKANGMTQQVLADYLGITQAFVSNMEAGRDTIPEKYIRKILDDPNVDSSMLSGGEEENITLNPRVDDVKMPREVFDKISQLIDTVCSQQGTIASQQDLLAKMQYVVDKSITPPPISEQILWMGQIQREIKEIQQLGDNIRKNNMSFSIWNARRTMLNDS